MFLEIKNRLEKELAGYIRDIDKTYRLNKLSPILFNNIKEFISRPGKRIRPIIFCIAYRGFSRKIAPGLYRSALALELLHDFMLVHDDIIDKSCMRRGKPSMHSSLNRYLENKGNIKFSGEDLAIVIGDVIYAMALDAFLSVRENSVRKELALKRLNLATLFTGSGEFIELLLGAKPMKKITKQDIYKIYDYKTANYTFASPLAMGAILAGAKNNQIEILSDYGMRLGRAFQIKDDIIGTFGQESVTGKSNLTDINEAKKTILIWYAYNHCPKTGRKAIEEIFSAREAGNKELLKMRAVITDSGSLDYAKKEIRGLLYQSESLIKLSGLRKEYRLALINFARKILIS